MHPGTWVLNQIKSGHLFQFIAGNNFFPLNVRLMLKLVELYNIKAIFTAIDTDLT